MTEWIKCNDKLPDNHEKVLVINFEMHDIARYENNKWFSLCWNRQMNDSVTHWMPLPNPPEELE